MTCDIDDDAADQYYATGDVLDLQAKVRGLEAELAAEYERHEELRLAYDGRLTLAEAERDKLRELLREAYDDVALIAENYELAARIDALLKEIEG